MEIQKQDIELYNQVKYLIEQSRRRVAETVNFEISQLYWNIGRYIKHEILIGERALYGKKVVKELSQYLTEEYGRG